MASRECREVAESEQLARALRGITYCSMYAPLGAAI